MTGKRKIATVIAIMVLAACVHAGTIPSLTLTNVGFNGDIYNVGEQGTPGAPVRILDSPQGSSYTLKEAYISTLELSGKGTVILENCTVGGAVTITGPADGGSLTVQFKKTGTGTSTISGNIEIRGNASLSLTDTALNSDVTGLKGFKGSFSMSGGSFGNTPSLLFGERKLSSFSVSGTTGNIGTINLTENTLADGFTLSPTSGTINELHLSGCKSTSVVSGINAGKNSWEFGTPGILDISNTGLNAGDTSHPSWWSINNGTIKELRISGNTTITQLNVNTDSALRNNNSLKKLYASGCGITSATIWMGGSSGPESGSVLDLSGNSLGSDYTKETYQVRTLTGQTSDSYPGSETDSECGKLNKVVSNIEQKTVEPEEDPETGEMSGGETYYTYDENDFIYLETGRNLILNGNRITTYFWGGRNWNYDTFAGLIDGRNSNLTNWPSGKISGSTSRVTIDFASEWSGLEAIDVNLQNNGIEYTAGFQTLTSKFDAWISFRVRTGRLASGLYIGSMTPSSGENNSQSTDAYIALDGEDSSNQMWNLPNTGDDDEKFLPLTASGSAFTTRIDPVPTGGSNTNTQTVRQFTTHTFIIHRWKDYGGLGAHSLRGLDMYIHPFGDDGDHIGSH